MLTIHYVDEKSRHQQLQGKLAAQTATWLQERENLSKEVENLQEKLAQMQQGLTEATGTLERRSREAESAKEELTVASARLDEARQQRDSLATEMQGKHERVNEVEARLGDCEEAREKCVKGEMIQADAKELLLDELKAQNERLAAKSQELQLKVAQLKENCEQTHWKSEGSDSFSFFFFFLFFFHLIHFLFLHLAARASAETMSSGGKGVVVYVAQKRQFEDLLLSLELLQANFLYCFPYPVHIFMGDDFTDSEVASIRDMLPGDRGVVFESICLEDCVPGGYSSVPVVKDWISSNHLAKSLGDLNRERFLAGEIFRSPSLSKFEFMWYLEPTTFITVRIS